MALDRPNGLGLVSSIRITLLISLAMLVSAACAPAGPGEARDGSAPASVTRGPKVLRVGDREGPKDSLGIVGVGGTGAGEVAYFFSAGLTAYDADGKLQPRMAQKVPRVEDGDWKILPDGGMEVTWKLRPNAVWHDGVPLSSADYEFADRLLHDRAIPMPGRDGYTANAIVSITASDPQTFVTRWRQPYLYANAAAPNALPPVPRHLLWDLYQQGDAQVFINHPYWTSQYVGVGPFRVTNWVEGSSIEGEAFDQYVLGRPKIDRLIVRLIADRNALVVNILAGEIDVILPGNIGSLDLKTIKDSWEPVQGGTALPIMQGTRALHPQLRDPNAPWARDVRIREAMAYMLDRQAMADELQLGFTIPADASITPKDPTWPLVERRGFKRRPYDLGQAQRLMVEAGWTRGGDGLYRNAAGQPLSIEVRGGTDFIQEITVVAAQWKEAGLDSTVFAIPQTSPDQREMQATFPGVLATGGGSFDSHTEANIASAENRWSGGNRGAYRNPLLEQTIREWTANAFDEAKRLPIQAEILKLINDEVVYLSMYYNVRGQAWSKALRGPGPFETPLTLIGSWNIHEWEII